MIGAISMIVMSAHYLGSTHSGILRTKEIASSNWYLVAFRLHVFFGLLAITFGPIQFVSRIRERNKLIHRVNGYFYIASVFTSSISGIIVAQFAMGGWLTTIGFSILAIMWFFTTLKSVSAILKGEILVHRKWAHFSYALTFSAITQRILLLIPLLTEAPFMPIYQLSAWLPWVINLLIAQLLLEKSLSIRTSDMR